MASFDDFVDSSVITIPDTEFGIKKEAKTRYSTMSQCGDFSLLVIKHKRVSRRATALHPVGFQGAYIEVGNGRGDIDFKVRYDKDRDGKDRISNKRTTLYPVGDFKFLKGAVPKTALNMDVLAQLFYTGPYLLDKMTPNYDSVYNELKKIAEEKYKEVEKVTPEKALINSEEMTNTLRDKVKTLEGEKNQIYELTKKLIGKTDSDKLYVEARELVKEENPDLIKELKKAAHMDGKAIWHTTSEYKNKITPLVKAKFIHLAEGYKK